MTNDSCSCLLLLLLSFEEPSDVDLRSVESQNKHVIGTKHIHRSFLVQRRLHNFPMANNKDEAVAKARKDLARRLGLNDNDISEQSVEETDFPDTALGAGGEDEMSGQMITRGWRIRLQAKGQPYEYRADRNQLRLYDYKGKNHVI